MRELRYRTTADDLGRRIAEGEFAAGSMLPSEAELVAAYDVSRVTVRKALELMRAHGVVEARQGLGWFVAEPLRQTLGRLGTIESQLAASGVSAQRRILEFGFVRAARRVRRALEVERVLRVKRLNLADGKPFARITVWVPGELAEGLSREEVERSTFYELLAVPLGSALQTIGASVATTSDASLLGILPGAPVLNCARTTFDQTGRAVLYSEHVFPAHRTEFVVELAQVDRSMSPTGFRLVDQVGT